MNSDLNGKRDKEGNFNTDLNGKRDKEGNYKH